MPGYRGHLLGGLAAAGLGLWAGHRWGVVSVDAHAAAFLTGTAVAAALFPDVDTDSKGQRWFYACFLALDVALIHQRRYAWAAVLGLLAMLPAVGRHRGWTHTWWAALAVPLAALAVPGYVLHVPPQELLPFYGAAVTGYLSHLLLDWVW